MNRNDSPTAQTEEDLPRLRLCPRHLCGSTDDAVWRGIDPPRVLIQHLIMRKKCFFFFFPQLKPQTTFEDKRQTANSGAPRDEGERERWNKKKNQMTVGKGKKK